MKKLVMKKKYKSLTAGEKGIHILIMNFHITSKIFV